MPSHESSIGPVLSERHPGDAPYHVYEWAIAGTPFHLVLAEMPQRYGGDLGELIPLRERVGTRTYFQGDFLHEANRSKSAGWLSAWYYTPERTLILHDCALKPKERQAGRVEEDPRVALIWEHCEAALLARLPQAERIVVPARSIYPEENWRRFLLRRGYEQVSEHAFGTAAERQTKDERT